MNRFKSVMMWIVIVLIVMLSVLNILLVFYLNNEHEKKIDQKIQEIIKTIPVSKTPTKGVDGKTPIKNVDYFDGKDSINTHTVETFIKEVPVNGKDGKDAYIDIRCNSTKNRWEVRYSPSENFQAMYDELDKKVKCLGA